MTLKIEVENVNSSNAVDICAACRDAVEKINGLFCDTKPFDLLAMTFSFEKDKTPIFRGEDSPLSRYLSSTTPGGKES